MICELDSGPEARILVMINPNGRLLEARKFCDGCIRSGRAWRELKISVELDPQSLSGFKSLREVIEQTIYDAIDATGGNMNAAARLLKISRSTMYRQLDRMRGRKASTFLPDESSEEKSEEKLTNE